MKKEKKIEWEKLYDGSGLRTTIHNAFGEYGVENEELEDVLYRLFCKFNDRTSKNREKEVSEIKEALIWCSGSDDFQEGGKARIGWLKICQPLIDKPQ